MAKPGMDRRKFRIRAGLLILSLGLSLGTLLWAQDDAPASLEVFIQTTPVYPTFEEGWTITILVNHPVPAEVTVIPPEFPPALRLDRVRMESRFFTRPAGPEEQGIPRDPSQWTAVEYRFIPQGGGELLIKPFEVFAPGKRALTPELKTLIHRGKAPWFTPRLVWEAKPAVLRVGEAAELRLKLEGSNPAAPPQGAPVYPIEAPENAIIETFRPAGGSGLSLGIRIIPLKGPAFKLKAASITWDTYTLQVPALEFPILPALAPGSRAAPASADGTAPPPGPMAFTSPGSTSLGSAPPEAAPVAAALGVTGFSLKSHRFSQETPGQGEPGIQRRVVEAVLSEAQERLDQGQIAEALALLRRGERDLLGGSALKAPRQALEERLGLGPQEDEPPRERFLAIAFLSLILLGLIIIFYLRKRIRRKKGVTSHSSWGYRGISWILIPILLLGISGIMALVFWNTIAEGGVKGRSGVLKTAEIFLIPEAEGTPEGYFKEGERGIIRSVAGSWVYVESLDGRAGWIPSDRIVPY